MTNAPTLQDLLRKYAVPVPRYTSYPTAPHFHGGVGPERYAEWLRDVPAGSDVSLYLHVPYCDTLCWFCGCHTKIVRRYEPVRSYLGQVRDEASLVAEHLPHGPRLAAIHWGGGSPTLLRPEDILETAQHCRSMLPAVDRLEFAVEIDPRDLDGERIAALAEAGVNRASIGVQDFDPRVQKAINRLQSFEVTAGTVEGLRAAGVRRINIDLLYGLPFQTEASLTETLEKTLALSPDRLALFGYAHVPWMKTHQKLIPEDALPGPEVRLAQFVRASGLLEAAGYVRIGIDHFARPDDPLAVATRSGTLRRNFQGYTTDAAGSLVGLGASSIGSFEGGYVQNVVAIRDYERAVRERRLPVARGIVLDDDDRLRRYAIERLMCDFVLSYTELAERFGDRAGGLLPEVARMEDLEQDGLIERTPDGFLVTETGRFFVRAISARFDAYLARNAARHSIAV